MAYFQPVIEALGKRPRRLVSAAIVLGLLTTGGVLAATSPAYAEDYPSWTDVANARNNESSAKAAVAQIQSLLAGLQADVDRTQKDSQEKGEVWRAADDKFQVAAAKAQNLQDQADAANVVANASEQRAGQLAAQLMRGGSGSDLTTTLLTSTGAKSNNLLYDLGMSTKISEQANAIYERAIQDKNTAQSLTDGANVAKNELKSIKDVAQKAFDEAQVAAKAASAALTAQQDHAAQLQQQLIVLTENREATEADFIAGIKARTGNGASLGAAQISLSGWALPASGPITDGFGWRVSPTEGASSYHQGTDIGAGCGSPIFAASSGTVEYAGWNGGYGNFILIDHGGGVESAYGHIVNGGTLVQSGEQVIVGEQIASVGTTGTSTGCHLHFEIRLGGVATNSVPFMSDRGISIG